MPDLRPRCTMNTSPFLLIESEPPVCVSAYTTEGFPFLSSLTTLLLSFCAMSKPPLLVPTMPSPLLPASCQTNFQRCPPAITPGISLIVYSRGPGAGAGPRPPARPGPPPHPGGILHLPTVAA